MASETHDMDFLTWLLSLLLACVTAFVGYELGKMQGDQAGYMRCLAYNDGDTPSGAEVSR